MTAADLGYADVLVGSEAEFRHLVTDEDVRRFAETSGDFNPLHVNPAYAAATRFQRCIVHGMFLGGLISRLVGMYLPGRRCLYLSQSMDFVHPAFVGDDLLVSGTVLNKQDATQALMIRTEITNAQKVVVLRGKAHVQFLA